MNIIFAYIVFAVYTSALLYITIYCVIQFHLLFHYKRHHWQQNGKAPEVPKIQEDLPFVTIQLPVFNERYVVERLIDNITKLDYPKDRYEIHLLDDSTDESVALGKAKVAEYQAQGFNIEHVIRENRQGYKAGALRDGMPFSKGEFIAIFDADFLPNPDFLKKTIPYFQDPKVGVVQTRWEHINQDYSILTQLQAFQLNVHFTVEQLGRNSGDYLLQFNGTAGVWRKETIQDAGGWEADTLTEDLDLSYRAQLKGWRIEYLEHIVSPAELPAEMNGLKSQQHRWMKGGAETARKILPTIWKSSLSFSQKIHATTHLMSSSVFLFVFILGVFSVPLIFFINPLGINHKFFIYFLLSLILISIVYYVANVQAVWKEESRIKMIFKFFFLFPIFLALSMGLSFHNSLAVIQGYLGKKSAFIRTPKFNIQNFSDSFKNRAYLAKRLPGTTILEGLLTLYFIGGFTAGIWFKDWTFIVLHFLLIVGYGTIFFLSLKHLNFRS